MEIKNQVVSLDLAKKMKELGFEQESYFAYILGVNEGWIDYLLMDGEHEPGEYNDKIAAYTVAELGEMLPQGSYSLRDNGDKAGTPELWACHFKDNQGYVATSIGITEADARAKMLIYLK